MSVCLSCLCLLRGELGTWGKEKQQQKLSWVGWRCCSPTLVLLPSHRGTVCAHGLPSLGTGTCPSAGGRWGVLEGAEVSLLCPSGLGQLVELVVSTHSAAAKSIMKLLEYEEFQCE